MQEPPQERYSQTLLTSRLSRRNQTSVKSNQTKVSWVLQFSLTVNRIFNLDFYESGFVPKDSLTVLLHVNAMLLLSQKKSRQYKDELSRPRYTASQPGRQVASRSCVFEKWMYFEWCGSVRAGKCRQSDSAWEHRHKTALLNILRGERKEAFWALQTLSFAQHQALHGLLLLLLSRRKKFAVVRFVINANFSVSTTRSSRLLPGRKTAAFFLSIQGLNRRNPTELLLAFGVNSGDICQHRRGLVGDRALSA